MTNNDNTRTDASILADTAEAVRVTLAKDISDAQRAGTALLVKRYGAGADPASIRLAMQSAAVLAGGTKPRGNNGAKINDVLRAVGDVEVTDLTPATLATAARTVLDARAAAAKAARKAESEERAALKDKLNDRGAAKGDRRIAFDAITALDAKGSDAKRAALAERVTAALTAARDGGLSPEWVTSILFDVYPVLDTRAETIAA